MGIKFERCATFHTPDRITLNGHEYLLYVPDEEGVKGAFIELFFDDCYGCRDLAEDADPIKTVLDIGANVGLFSVMARSSFPEAVIHAYEPSPLLDRYINKQAGEAKFTHFSEAIGLEDGRVSLDIQAESVFTRSTTDSGGGITQKALRTAVGLLGGQVDFLKLDCEGAEWELFQDKASWKHIRNVSMEYHLWSGHTLGEVTRTMDELGFRIKKHTRMGDVGVVIASRRN